MKIKLLTYCDTAYKDIGDVSVPVMRSYCKLHGIDFELHEKITSQHSDVYWNKISMVKQALAQYDWVIWMDADILILDKDFDCKKYLSGLNDKDLVISSDFRGICMGLFFIRNCPWSISLLNTLEYLGNIKNEKIGLYDVRNQREQDSLKVILDFYDAVSSKTERIPESVVSNPKTTPVVPDAFAYHFWANGNPPKIAAAMKEYVFTKPGQV